MMQVKERAFVFLSRIAFIVVLGAGFAGGGASPSRGL